MRPSYWSRSSACSGPPWVTIFCMCKPTSGHRFGLHSHPFGFHFWTARIPFRSPFFCLLLRPALCRKKTKKGVLAPRSSCFVQPSPFIARQQKRGRETTCFSRLRAPAAVSIIDLPPPPSCGKTCRCLWIRDIKSPREAGVPGSHNHVRVAPQGP